LGLYQRSATASTPEERQSHDEVLDAVLPD
jgi:hypothetical protein